MAVSNAATDSKLFGYFYPKGYSPYRTKWYDVLIAILLFVITFIGYIRTLTPSMGAGDNGELITALQNMGACHPPGYPLYAIIGKLFTFIPVGDIGYRVNLFVAMFGALAILFLYLSSIKIIGLNRDTGSFNLKVQLPAIAASFLFAFSFSHWNQSTSGEVYPLNQFLVSFMVYIMVLWYEEMIQFRREPTLHFADRMTIFLFFAMGLSLTDHQLPVWYIAAFVIVLLPLTIAIIVSDRSRKFFDELKARMGIVILLGVMTAISLLLFYVFAFNNPLIPPIKNPDTGDIRLDIVYVLVGIFLVPVTLAIYAVVVKTRRMQDNWVDRLAVTGTYAVWFFLFAMSLYLFLMVRARALAPLPDPKPFSWGDTQTIDILFNHMLRRQYGMGGGKEFTNFFGQLQAVLGYFLHQYGWINFLIGVAGAVYLWFKDKVWALFIGFAILLHCLILVRFINFELDPRTLSFQEVFFIQNFMIWAIYIAAGFQLLFDLPKVIPQAAGFIKNGFKKAL